MKVLVCGGRDFANYGWLKETLDGLFNCGEADSMPIDMLIHGGALGADALAGRWAQSVGVMEVIVPANWDYYGKSAGPERNCWMLRLKPDLVIAFPGGAGTAHMARTATAQGIKVTKIV